MGIIHELEMIDEIISEWEQKIKDLQFSIKQFKNWKKELKEMKVSDHLLEKLDLLEKKSKDLEEKIDYTRHTKFRILEKQIGELQESIKALGGFSNEHAESISENTKSIEILEQMEKKEVKEINKIMTPNEIIEILDEKLDSSKRTDCLLNKPHGQARNIERKLIEKCQCPIHGRDEQYIRATMTDDEIMRFNEEFMAKISKREVQPLEDSGSEKVEGDSKVSVATNVSMQKVGSPTKSDDDSKLPELQIIDEHVNFGEHIGSEKSDKNKELVLGQTTDKPMRSIVPPISDSKLPEYGLTQKGLDAVDKIIKRSPQYKELKRQIYEDLLACRGMNYKEMISYILALEMKYDE